MLNYSHKHLAGISLLEMLLVLMLVAVGITLGLQQYFQYKRLKDITQIQQSIEQLLQAGSAYYYATCNMGFVTPVSISLTDLQVMGGLPNPKQIINPWGDKPFEVWIISGNGASAHASGPPYLIQVKADFSDANYTAEQVGQLVNLLGADNWAGGKQLSWTRLPTQVAKFRPMSVQSPGGWVPSISGTYNGGQSITSNYEVMNADLAKFSKDEAKNAGGYTCPN